MSERLRWVRRIVAAVGLTLVLVGGISILARGCGASDSSAAGESRVTRTGVIAS